MGIGSEISADEEASQYEEILFAALETRNPDVIKFCRSMIWGPYQNAIGNTWGYRKTDPKLEASFKSEVK